ncbi:MAG: 3-deoxy-D-manno-octulosonic acid transferase [Alphaproteobacteria bacterium]|nr:3-deoxy-D-manno-octulosonic acid transferase [Alphaproteobacteria bacterium]
MSIAGEASLRLYRAVTSVAEPLAQFLLRHRATQGKESSERLPERVGLSHRARPDGALVWVHGASVGESLSALPLIEALLAQYPNAHALVTTGTVTSAAPMADRLPARAFHQFVPVDSPRFVRRFLDHWRPDLALWLESEFWPNLLLEAEARGIAIALVNGRLSERSFKGWQRARPVFRRLIDAFSLILAQDKATAERLSALGARDPIVTGNLKTDAEKLPVDETALRVLRELIGARPLWLAASTHPGEDLPVAEAARAVRAQIPDALLILVPRHPARGPGIAEALREAGEHVARRGAGEALQPQTQIYLADTLGELGLYYRLAPVAFVGGSLVPHGGQNPYEPARLGVTILHGPHIANFADAYRALDGVQGAIAVNSARALGEAVGGLLLDETARSQIAARAAEALAGGQALGATLAALGPLCRQRLAHAGA